MVFPCWFRICVCKIHDTFFFFSLSLLSCSVQLSAAWCSLKLDLTLFLTLSLSKNEKWALNPLKTALCEEQGRCFHCVKRGSFSPHCVWHLSALVWAWSRACLVSLPSSIPFPDFLCMLRLTASLCERLSVAGGVCDCVLILNLQLIILCDGKQSNRRLNKLGLSGQISRF